MLGILLTTLLCNGCVDKPAEAPSATVVFFARPDQIAVVEVVARQYAEDQRFLYSAERLGSRTPQEIVIHLVRPDVQIIGRDPFAPGRFQFFFYKTRTPSAASDEEIGSLTEQFVSDLEAAGEFEIERRR